MRQRFRLASAPEAQRSPRNRSFRVQHGWAIRGIMISRRYMSSLAAIALLGAGASGFPDVAPAQAAAGERVVQVAAADCYRTAQRVAAERGGRVHSAEAATRGGRTVCVIVIVVPGREGQRGRVVEVEVPAD